MRALTCLFKALPVVALPVASLLVAAGPALALPPVEQRPTFTIVGVTVHTQQAGVPALTDGVVVVAKGRVTCLGVRHPDPKAAHPLQRKTCESLGQTYDYAGKGVVVPGLIEALGRVGQIEVDAEEASQDGVARQQTNNANVQAIDGLHLASRVVDATRRGGVTAVLVRPLGGALIAGQSVAYRTIGQVVEDGLVKNPVAVHVNLGEEAKVDRPLVGARSGQIAVLRDQLERARRLAQAEGKKPRDPAEREAVERLRDDPALQALVPVLQRKLPLVVHASRADDLAAALRLQAQFGVLMVLAGASEAHLLADRIAAAKVPVVLGPVRQKPYDFATRHAMLQAAARLHAAGVKLALASAETHNARNLRWEAGFAVVQGGLPWEAALLAITRNVAEIFGLGPGVGTLTEGQPADLVVFDGDPLSLDGHVRLVVTAGMAETDPAQQ